MLEITDLYKILIRCTNSRRTGSMAALLLRWAIRQDLRKTMYYFLNKYNTLIENFLSYVSTRSMTLG
jgi:hypothetical protein